MSELKPGERVIINEKVIGTGIEHLLGKKGFVNRLMDVTSIGKIYEVNTSPNKTWFVFDYEMDIDEDYILKQLWED